MRNRELFTRRLEQVEGKLKTLRFMTTRGSELQEFLLEIENTENIIEDLKSQVENEPMEPNEINFINRQ